jgi:hypothetical protein
MSSSRCAARAARSSAASRAARSALACRRAPARRHALAPVLIGHAASLTPYLSDTPRPSPRTNRTRRVPHPVLIGHTPPPPPAVTPATRSRYGPQHSPPRGTGLARRAKMSGRRSASPPEIALLGPPPEIALLGPPPEIALLGPPPEIARLSPPGIHGADPRASEGPGRQTSAAAVLIEEESDSPCCLLGRARHIQWPQRFRWGARDTFNGPKGSEIAPEAQAAREGRRARRSQALAYHSTRETLRRGASAGRLGRGVSD